MPFVGFCGREKEKGSEKKISSVCLMKKKKKKGDSLGP